MLKSRKQKRLAKINRERMIPKRVQSQSLPHENQFETHCTARAFRLRRIGRRPGRSRAQGGGDIAGALKEALDTHEITYGRRSRTPTADGEENTGYQVARHEHSAGNQLHAARTGVRSHTPDHQLAQCQ